MGGSDHPQREAQQICWALVAATLSLPASGHNSCSGRASFIPNSPRIFGRCDGGTLVMAWCLASTWPHAAVGALRCVPVALAGGGPWPCWVGVDPRLGDCTGASFAKRQLVVRICSTARRGGAANAQPEFRRTRSAWLLSRSGSPVPISCRAFLILYVIA